MKKIRVTFFGSSSSTDDYSKDIQTIFECLFTVYDEVIVVNGGYQGTMKDIAEKGKTIAKELNKKIYVQGILFDDYKNDSVQSGVNNPNDYSDAQISSTSIGERVQSMIELADIVIALPGKTGTLHEIIQTIETIQWGMDYSKVKDNFNRLLIHSSWKKSFDNLNHNENISEDIYNHFKDNFFSFESEKERIINKLENITITPIVVKSENENNIVYFPNKTFDHAAKKELSDSHKLAKVISEINQVLYGAYFDKTKKNKVVGIDIALKEVNKEIGKLFRLDSVGSNKYLNILDSFLSKYKSVIENDSRVNEWYQINNIEDTNTNELFYQDHKNKSSLNGSEDGTIQKWIEYLEKNNLGKHLYWMSVKDEHFHISTYLVLDCILPENLKNKVEKVVNQFLLEYMLVESADEYIKIAFKESFNSSISDIIKRNEAHHITSHVSNRATLDKVLERIEKSHTELSDANFYHTILDLLNRFNQYRDERSEYLTSITNFSSPSSAYFFQDVIRPFVENTLLMDNIAANENINYEKDTNGSLTNNKLQLKLKWNTNLKQEDFYAEYFDTTSDNKLYSSENLPYLRLKDDLFEYPYDKIEFSNNQKDIEISLPGTLGKHAMYSLLENFIRNSAKHGGIAKFKRLEIILLLADENDDNITVTLTDNCSVVSEENIKEFNKSIQTDIHKRKDLGLIDMKVNACLLAGMELNDENCKKALTAVLHNKKLAYKFKIAKPKKAVFIGDFVKEERKDNGFFFFKTIEDYSKSDIHKSFQFAVLADNLYKQQKAEIACELPARVLKYSEIEKDKAKNFEHLYEIWLKKLRGDEKVNIHLYFEQNNNTHPTEEFKTKYGNHQSLKIYSNEDLNTDLTIANKKNVFYDRHGGLIGKFSKEKSFVDTNHSWILIDKNNPDFDYISRYDIENKTNLLAYELEEAGLLKVLVIDERVAEQSVRTINDTHAIKLRQKQRSDFWKWEEQNSMFNLTLFDLAWASNVFLATHLGEVELKQKINVQTEHCLKVKFNKGGIELETNIPSHSAYRKQEKWYDKKVEDKEIGSSQSETINIKPDVVIIHRTKLKELLTANSNFVKELLNKNEGINLVVTTGSGTTHGIEGDYKILPFATLSKLILGKRINKLQLSKTLLELTKNKI